MQEDILKCENCNTSLEAEFVYCPKCGQERFFERNLTGLLSHFMSDYFTFDSKIIRSVKPLISKPGFLTNEYLKGKRMLYISPLRMFIFLSIIFFLVLSFFNSSQIQYADIQPVDNQFWNQFFEQWLPKLFFVLLPIFALIVAMFFSKKKMGMISHFLFALHFHSSIFLVGIIYSFLSWIFAGFQHQLINVILLNLSFLYLLFNLWKALRTVYAESKLKTTWKFIFIVVLYSIILVVSCLILLFLLSINH